MPMFNTSQDIQSIALSHPIPGASMTRQYRGDPWQNPPQFTKLEDGLEYLFDKLTEPYFLHNLMHLFELNASVESIARTILFTGFTQGKWTPSLMLLLYKPTLMLIAALAHKAGYRHIPMIEPTNHGDYHKRQMDMHQLAGSIRNERNLSDSTFKVAVEGKGNRGKADFMDNLSPPTTGFMNRGNS